MGPPVVMTANSPERRVFGCRVDEFAAFFLVLFGGSCLVLFLLDSEWDRQVNWFEHVAGDAAQRIEVEYLDEILSGGGNGNAATARLVSDLKTAIVTIPGALRIEVVAPGSGTPIRLAGVEMRGSKPRTIGPGVIRASDVSVVREVLASPGPKLKQTGYFHEDSVVTVASPIVHPLEGRTLAIVVIDADGRKMRSTLNAALYRGIGCLLIILVGYILQVVFRRRWNDALVAGAFGEGQSLFLRAGPGCVTLVLGGVVTLLLWNESRLRVESRFAYMLRNDVHACVDALTDAVADVETNLVLLGRLRENAGQQQRAMWVGIQNAMIQMPDSWRLSWLASGDSSVSFLGIPSFSTDNIRQYLARSAQERRSLLTGPFVLPGPIRDTVVALVVPWERGAGVRDSGAGWVVGVFRSKPLLGHFLHAECDPGFGVQIEDDASTGKIRTLFEKRVLEGTTGMPEQAIVQDFPPIPLEIMGRPWKVRIAEGRLYGQEHRDAVKPIWVLFAGGVLTLLLTQLTSRIFSHKLRAESRVAERTSALSDAMAIASDTLRQLNQQKAAIDQHAIVSITDASGLITYANEKFCEISGYMLRELLGSDHRIVRSDVHSPEFYREISARIAAGEIWHGTLCNRRKDGGRY